MKGYNNFEMKKFLSMPERKRRQTKLHKELFLRHKRLGTMSLRRQKLIESILDVLFQYQDVNDLFEISLFHSYMIELEEVMTYEEIN